METKKGPPLSEAVPLCGRMDNYRSHFEDFDAIYLFGISDPHIAIPCLVLGLQAMRHMKVKRSVKAVVGFDDTA